MRKIGKISTIKREQSQSGVLTMSDGLRKKGLTRVPGTSVYKYPYKELDGKYRTGLDPDASYIRRIEDPIERDLEIKRVKDTKDRLQKAFEGIDLGPYSSYWNSGLRKSTNDTTHVSACKMTDGDNFFDLSIPSQELTFSWLRVHPTIASSYQAWARGEYPADTVYYVVDEDVENEILFNKKKTVNKAISKFETMSPGRKKKVARLLGLSVSDNTKEEVVYNMVDSFLKASELTSGAYKGMSPVDVFTRFADMKEGLLHVRDLIKQAISHSVYRTRTGGSIYEGENKIAANEEELINYLMDDDNQEDLVLLEEKVNTKKIAAI